MNELGRIQIMAKIPEDMHRAFKTLLVWRRQSFNGWLQDHIVAALEEEKRHPTTDLPPALLRLLMEGS
jgi:hypothetical protein